MKGGRGFRVIASPFNSTDASIPAREYWKIPFNLIRCISVIKRKKKYIPKNVVVKRGSAGLGLFAGEPIKKGDFIIEYIGKVMTSEEADDKGGMYLFDISSRKVVDGTTRKNTARYINHSCRPNCETEVKGGRIYVFAKRAIRSGEELSYDYGKEYFDDYIKPKGCRCSHCLGQGKDKKRLPHQQRRDSGNES